MEKMLNFINAVKRMRNDFHWFLKLQGVYLKCIYLKKLKNWL